MTSGARDSTYRTTRTTTRQPTSVTPTAGRLDWIREMLDKPLASFHLVLASAGLLVALGLMMVLSSSSVYAYQQYDDAYHFLKRQAVFLVLGLIGAFLVTRMSRSLLRFSAWIAWSLQRRWSS